MEQQHSRYCRKVSGHLVPGYLHFEDLYRAFANADGYVEMPNVDLVKEITDAMAATQAYSANVTAFNTLKTVATRALDIGK